MARAGVEGRVQLRQGLQRFTKDTILEQRKDLVETAKVAAVLAEAAGKDKIWHTPSSLSNTPKDDRVWTGKMVDAFEADVTVTGRNITVRWGWIDTKKKYFLIQEYGGEAFGKTVTPMFALADAKNVVTHYLSQKGIQA